MTDRFWEDGYPTKFVFDEIEPAEFTAEFLRGAFDPVNFVRISFSRHDPGGHTTSWLRTLGEKMVTTILDCRGRLESLREIASFIGKGDSSVREDITAGLVARSHDIKVEHLHRLVNETKRGYDRLSISKKHALSAVSANPDISPSFTALVNVYRQYHLDNLDKFESAPRPERSAIADILHAMYLPYVDVFRADRRFSDVLRKAKLPWQTTVVPSLTDLPSAIDAALRRRAKGQ